MSRRTRVLVALYGTAAVLAAIPWAIDTADRLIRRTPWRPPAVPHFRLDTPRRSST